MKKLLQQALDAMKKYQVKSGDFDRFENEVLALEAELSKPDHYSDCAVYNEPAYPKGKCDCGGHKPEQDHGFDRTASHMAGEYVDTKQVYTSEERVQKSDKSIHEVQRIGQELEQDPVAWMLPEYGDVLSASEADGNGVYNIPLYVAPPRKEWVGLTDDEIDAIGYKYGAGGLEVAAEVQIKLKEKNNA